MIDQFCRQPHNEQNAITCN